MTSIGLSSQQTDSTHKASCQLPGTHRRAGPSPCRWEVHVHFTPLLALPFQAPMSALASLRKRAGPCRTPWLRSLLSPVVACVEGRALCEMFQTSELSGSCHFPQ